MPDRSSLRVDGGRLVDRLDALAQIGAIVGTQGCCRLALTDEDRSGRDLVVTWMRDLGLEVTIDAIGNVIAQMAHPSARAPVMTGSHIDTVATGGRFDGNLGVLAGLEVIESVQTAGVELSRPLAVGFFTDEEGARFAPDMMGSLVYVGGLPLEEAHDIRGIDGAILGEELARIGYLGPGPCPGPAPHAYVELHIEQGPVLEAEHYRIGAVTGVQGISWTELTITGQSNHAGTTPMSMRRDAAYVAARITTFVRDLTAELGHGQVGTVGKLDLTPDLINVVAASVTMTVDLRNTDEALLEAAERRLAAFVEDASATEGVTVDARRIARFEPVAFDDRVVSLVEKTALDHGHATKRMPSGAGHDAQMLARVCPTGMVFVPSAKGLSHNPAEHTDAADIEAGANVLLQVMLELTDQEFA
jgi:N-carbamoyl-L-amino-acid hydrolase